MCPWKDLGDARATLVPRGLSAEAEATDGDLELDHKVDSTQVLKKNMHFVSQMRYFLYLTH